MHGVLDTEKTKSLPLEKVDGMMSAWGYPHIATYMFAANSRTMADRARKVLGYEPVAPSLWDTMEADFDAALKENQQKKR